MNPSTNAKAASPPKVTAIARIHLDLDAMVRRLRREIWIGGILAVGTATITSILLMLVVDATFQPEAIWLRVAFWLPIIGVVGVVTRHFFVLPLRQKCDRLAMAWTLEQKQPTIEERLTSSLQLTESQNAKTSSIIEAVAEQAHSSLAGCEGENQHGHEVKTRTAIAGVALAALVLSMWIWSPWLIPSLRNMFNPWSARVLPHLNATITPGDTHIAEGNDLQITATSSHFSDAVLEVIENGAVIASHQMATDDNGTTADFTLTGLKQNRIYRVRDGGLYSYCFQIVVDPKPIYLGSQVRLAFPDYSHIPAQCINDPVEPIEVLDGTRIRIDVDSNLPASDSTLSLNGVLNHCGEAVAIEESGRWRHSWEFTATADDSKIGTITLVSEAGVHGDPVTFDFRVLPDQPPTITIDQPALPDVTAKPEQQIDVAFHALDDFGISNLFLTTQKNNDEPLQIEISNDSNADQLGETNVDLNELELTVGDQLTFWISVSDNRPDEYGGMQLIDSRKIHVQIADASIPVGQQVAINEATNVLAELTNALDQLHQAAEITEELRADNGVDLIQKDPANLVDAEKSKQLQDRINDAEQALRRLSDHSEAPPQRLFQPEIERIQDIAESDVSEAKQQARLIPLSNEPTQQQGAIEAADDSLNSAINKLEQVRSDIEERGKQLELAAKLDEIARQQERLAQQQQEGQANAPETQEQQQQVADALQNVVEENLDAKSKQFEQRAEEAARLTDTAKALQQQQEALAKLDQIQNKEGLEDKLLEMIAKEQEQIANETQKLEEQLRADQSPAVDKVEPTKQGESEPAKAERVNNANELAEARKQMESVPEKLRTNDLEQAEAKAHQAGERLQDQVNSLPKDAAEQPEDNTQANTDAKENSQQNKSDLERLTKQQPRVRDAINAVREDRPEEAAAKLQEQIADRTEQLREKADELLQRPTEDPENQQAVREAQEKLEQAERETKVAEQLAKQTSDPSETEKTEQTADKKQATEPQQGDNTQQAEEQNKIVTKSKLVFQNRPPIKRNPESPNMLVTRSK
ncbi:MAG: DUF4175 family protein [Pirellulaceae bacterium]